MHRTSGGVLDCLDPDLDAHPDDLAVERRGERVLPGACDLHEQLRDCGIDTLLMSGTLANVCRESSARDAVELGYRVVMVADANAARTGAELNATLHTMCRSFGDVRSTDDLVALLTGEAAPGRRPGVTRRNPRCSLPSCPVTRIRDGTRHRRRVVDM